MIRDWIIVFRITMEAKAPTAMCAYCMKTNSSSPRQEGTCDFPNTNAHALITELHEARGIKGH